MRFSIASLAVLLPVIPAAAASRRHAVRVPGPDVTFAIAISPRLDPPPTIDDILAAYDLAQSAGAQGKVVAYQWSELEPAPGAYALDDLVNETTYSHVARGMEVLLEIQVLNTNIRETPTDLAALPLDDPLVESRFRALVDAVAPLLRSLVTYLSIGNEVDVYLTDHPDEWGAYTRFYEDAIAYVHEVAPNVRVGVTSTYIGNLAGAAENVARLNEQSDVFILTYYPLASGFHPNAPDVAAADFDRMIELAGDRPILLQEVGYPSDPSLGSSEEAQAEFMENVFDAWRHRARRIPFLSIFALHDFSPDLCLQAAAYYGYPDAADLKAFLCSLGLRRVNGDPKPAWNVVSGEGVMLR